MEVQKYEHQLLDLRNLITLKDNVISIPNSRNYSRTKISDNKVYHVWLL